MSMFRRPTDNSESESESSEEEHHVQTKGHQEEDLEADLIRTETLSSGESISVGDQNEPNIINVEHHRNMMLASLLEDFYRTRAAELFNTAHSSSTYHRHSPEIQSFAKRLFEQASQTLVTGGVLPGSVTSDGVRRTRDQYLTGFDNLGLQNLQDNDLLPGPFERRLSVIAGESLALARPNERPSIVNTDLLEEPMHDLAMRTSTISLLHHSLNNVDFTRGPQSPHSHYQSSFQEMRLLGKGGFGRVYHTYNIFDKKEYAVKKIPLSPRLSQRYRERGHPELASILREVQALARLDHCNVVRYHATWIEEPTIVGPELIAPPSARPGYGQRLLMNQPALPSSDKKSSSATQLEDASNDVMFEADTEDHPQGAGPDWSFRAPDDHLLATSSAGDSDIFTDGMERRLSKDKTTDDPSCYVLHVQMSMYPMTLTQYMSPILPGSTRNPRSPGYRHCFHLVPALRIILGILCGLQYIHAHGMVHRDIKPGNIFMSTSEFADHVMVPDGFQEVGSCRSCLTGSVHYVNPRIGDFGLVAELARNAAEAQDALGSSSDKAAGTEYYRPPLIHNDKGRQYARIDEKLDVFALGVIFVELLCQCGTSMERLDMLRGLQIGQLPAHLVRTIDREGYDSQIGQLVKTCIHRMIDKDPCQRWSCNQVKTHVEHVLDGCNPPEVWSDLQKIVSLKGTDG